MGLAHSRFAGQQCKMATLGAHGLGQRDQLPDLALAPHVDAVRCRSPALNLRAGMISRPKARLAELIIPDHSPRGCFSLVL